MEIFNNRADYPPEQLIALQQIGESLLICEQGQTRTLEETRIMVAARRIKLEENFKIVVDKAPKVTKERQAKKLTKKAFLLILVKLEDKLEVSEEEAMDFKHSAQFWDKEGLLDFIELFGETLYVR